MATNKKTAASKTAGRKTATETETGIKGAPKPRPGGRGKGSAGGDYAEAYIRLRTVLDGLEMIALRYALETPDSGGRCRRADDLVAWLKPVINKIHKKLESAPSMPPGICPEGYYLCNGCCVPYPCPGTRADEK